MIFVYFQFIKRWNDATLTDPLNSSKTCWPVPHIESIFLPHFKVDPNNFESNYTIKNSLARGAFGKVFRVVHNKTEEEFALKVLSKAQVC